MPNFRLFYFIFTLNYIFIYFEPFVHLYAEIEMNETVFLQVKHVK